MLYQFIFTRLGFNRIDMVLQLNRRLFIFLFFLVPFPVSNLQEVQANDSALHIQWTNPDLTLTYFENFIVMATSDLDPLRSWNISGDKNEMIIMDLRAGYFYNISVVTNTGYETSDAVHQTFYTCKLVQQLTYCYWETCKRVIGK